MSGESTDSRSHDSHRLLNETIRFCFAIGCLTAILWKNANNFDITEYRAIAAFAAALGVGKWLKRYLPGAEE